MTYCLLWDISCYKKARKELEVAAATLYGDMEALIKWREQQVHRGTFVVS